MPVFCFGQISSGKQTMVCIGEENSDGEINGSLNDKSGRYNRQMAELKNLKTKRVSLTFLSKDQVVYNAFTLNFSHCPK